MITKGCVSGRLPLLSLCLSFVTISPVSSAGSEADHLQGLPSQSTTLPWVLCGTLQCTQIAPFFVDHLRLSFQLIPTASYLEIMSTWDSHWPHWSASLVGNFFSFSCPPLQSLQFGPQTCSILLPGSSPPILLSFQGASSCPSLFTFFCVRWRYLETLYLGQAVTTPAGTQVRDFYYSSCPPLPPLHSQPVYSTVLA